MKKIKKQIVVIAFVVVTVCVAALAAVYIEEDYYDKSLRVEKLVIRTKSGKEHAFKVEIADTPVSLEMGLMFREKMGRNHGMLFALSTSPQIVRFWMKNTLIPLDMVFISASGEIVKIHQNAEPRSLTGISSDYPVTAVLELNGGRTAELDIRPGDWVNHPYFAH